MTAELDAMIRTTTRIAGLPKRAAPLCAVAAHEALAELLDAGIGPDGTPWKPTRDGGRPLKHAAEAVRVSVHGTTILFSVEGHHFYHHIGIRVPQRPIVPFKSRTLPAPLAKAVLGALEREWKKTIAGGS